MSQSDGRHRVIQLGQRCVPGLFVRAEVIFIIDRAGLDRCQGSSGQFCACLVNRTLQFELDRLVIHLDDILEQVAAHALGETF